MPSFGQRQSKHEIQRSPLGSVWTAPAAVKGEADAAVVTYEPGRLGLAQDESDAKIEAFLERARQQKEFTSAAPHWASIHEVGRFPDGAYYVRDHVPGSASRLVSGRIRRSGWEVFRILDGVLRGLKELAEACGRPHGHLAPEHVLLPESKESAASALLTDPEGIRSGIDPEVKASDDLNAFVRLVGQLVLFTEDLSSSQSAAELGVSREHKPLVDFAQGLQPGIAAGTITLDKALETWEQEVRPHYKRPESRAAKIAASTVVLVCLVIVAWLYWPAVRDWLRPNGMNGGEESVDPAAWMEYEDAHFALLAELFEKLDPGRRAAYRNDPDLREWLEGFEDYVQRFGSFDTPEDVERITDPRRIDEREDLKRRVVDIYENLKETLAPEELPGNPGWAVLTRVATASQAFDDRGWKRAGRYLAALPGEVSLDDKLRLGDELPDDYSLADAIGEILTVAPKVGEIEERWETIRAHQGTITAAERHDFFKRFDPLRWTAGENDAAGGPGDLDALVSRLEEIEGLGQRLVDFLESADGWPKVKVEELPEWVRKPGEQVTPGLYERLLNEADEYKVLERDTELDRLSKAIAEKRGDIQGGLERLGKDQQQDVAKFTSGLTAAEAAYQKDVSGLARIKKNRPRIRRAAEKHLESLKELERSIGFVVATIGQDKREWLRSALAARSSFSLGAIRDFYGKWLERILDGTTEQNIDEDPDYPRKRAQIDGLRKTLVAGDRVVELPDPDSELSGRRFFAALDDLCKSEWETRLGEKLQGLGESDPRAIESLLTEALAGFEPWRRDLGSLATDFAAIEDRLDQFFLLDDPLEPPPEEGIGSLRSWLERWKARPLFQDERVTRALEPVRLRIEELYRVEALTDRQAVAAIARGAGGARRKEVELAAWRRLGKLEEPRWPQGTAELGEEKRIRERLTANLAGIEAGRERTLSEELSREARRRWQVCLRGLDDHSEIGKAVSLMKDFDLDRDASQEIEPPSSRWKILVYDFRNRLKELDGAKDDQVSQRVEELLARIDTRLPRFRELEDVAEVLNELKSATDPAKRAAGSPTDSGPASGKSVIRWKSEDRGDGRIVFSWRPDSPTPKAPEHIVEFRHLEHPPDGSRAFYLATTEVSAGLFIDVLQAVGKLADLEKLLRPTTRHEGPSVYTWPKGKPLEIREPRRGFDDGWLAGIPGTWLKFYRDGQARAPSPSHPMQQVSLGAALYLAHLVGCRLPTVDEWRLARDRQAEGGRGSAPNLRDRSWKVQNDHCAQREGDPGTGKKIFCDAGIFGSDLLGEGQKGPVAAPRVGEDDGSIWFRAALREPDGEFHDLIGNVAEFVSESVIEMGAPILAVADIKALIEQHQNGFRVIGGSALSPLEFEVDAPLELTARETRSSRAFYSDVGFRLAFTAPKEKLLRTIRGIVEAEGIYRRGQGR